MVLGRLVGILGCVRLLLLAQIQDAGGESEGTEVTEGCFRNSLTRTRTWTET